jgi:hypothetical protein
MSPEPLILIDRAKDVIREAKTLIQQEAELAELRRPPAARKKARINVSVPSAEATTPRLAR